MVLKPIILIIWVVSVSGFEEHLERLYPRDPRLLEDPAGAAWAFYTFPQGGIFYDRMEHNLIWKEAETGSVYAASQFWFEQTQGGYIGGQFHEDGRHMLNYAIWDIDADHITALPDGENCKRFGGEGEGAHCQVYMTFEMNRAYTFSVRYNGRNRTGAFWKGSMKDTVTGENTDIGTIYLLNSSGFDGYGKLQANCLTFQEYWLQNKHFYSSFCWDGPTFKQRRDRDTGAQLIVEPINGSGRTQPGHAVLGGCPGTVEGKQRPFVFFEAGPDVVERHDDPLWED